MKSGDKDAIVQRARQPGQGLHRVQGRSSTRPTPSRSARTRPRRSSTETAMAWHLEAVGSRRPARHRRSEDDGARGASSTRRSSTPGTRDGVREVRVPAHRQGGLADDLQDQVRDGRPALLPEATGPSAARRSTRSSQENPKGAGRGRSRVRLGALLPEHLRRRRTPRARTGRAAATCPAPKAKDDASKADDEQLKPKEMTDSQKGMVQRLQSVHLLHPARRRATPTARSSSSR